MLHYDGLAISLGSLKTSKSLGIGSYLDLIPLIDLCTKIPFNIIQLLPILDTHEDASPYNAISSVAFHPIYLSLNSIPLTADEQEAFESLQKEERYDYNQVLQLKLKVLKREFLKHFPIPQNDLSLSEFLKEHPEIRPYAAYKVLKSRFGNLPFQSWPDGYTKGSPALTDQLFNEDPINCYFYCYLQLLISHELTTVKNYATTCNVHLKCDLPLFMSRDSHEVFFNHEYFRDDLVAGTPPDSFNSEGQYWGFPVYNWSAIIQDHYAFWKRRFEAMEPYFSIARLDHVIGFFRIFAIKPNCSPKTGHFIPLSEHDALKEGDKHLLALTKLTNMHLVGEDLGTVFPGMRETLQKYQIAKTKIVRWEKTHSAYEPFSHYPYLTVVSLSNHDITLLQEWWNEEEEDRRLFCHSLSLPDSDLLTPEIRALILQKMHHANSCYRINLIQEYLAFNPDYTFKNVKLERINIPGTILSTNWTYRIKPTLDDLLQDTKWLSTLRKIME
jgi:4-alpha-glucanotransferase